MKSVTREDLLAMARAVDLVIPDNDLENVRIRVETLLGEMEKIELALGAEMDRLDPVPPVYPHEP